MEDAIQDKSYDTYVKNLEKQYDAAIREIDKEMRAWYQRFAENNEISYVNARKWLTTAELDEFKWTVEEYIEKARENSLSGEWVKELENASARVHVSRLDALKYQLRQQAELLTQAKIKAATNAAELAYTESYWHSAFEAQKGLGVGWTMQGIDGARLDKVLSRPWTTDNQTFTARCWTDKAKLVETVNQELTRMIATGAAPDKAINAIAKQFNTSKSNAGKLVMTESAYFSSAAQQDCFNELGVEEYRIVGTLDKSMCDLCGGMDGRVFKMSEFKVGATAPPFHPWCRCCTAPYFADMEGVGRRFARDPDDEFTYTVPKDMTYKQWKALQDDDSLKPTTSTQNNNDLQSRIRSRRQNFRNRNAETQQPVITDLTGMNNQQLAEWSKSNLKTQIGDLTGVNNEFAKEAIEAVRDFENKMGGTIDGLSIKFGGVKSGAYAQYDSKTNTIFLKKTGALAKVNEQMQKTNEKAIRKTGKVWDAVPTYKGSIFHELGHAVDHSTGQSLSASLMKTKDLETKAKRISIYAGNSGAIGAPRTSEAWAENFSAYMSGGSYAKSVSDDITSIIDDYFKRISLDKSARSGIIKSLDIDDFELLAYGKVAPEATEIMTSVIKRYEKEGKIFINDCYFGSLPSKGNGTPLLQIEPIGDKNIRLNVNTDIFSGRTVEEINEIIAKSVDNVANTLEEAIIHECGHARLIKGMTVKEIEELYANIVNAKIEGVSVIAYNDGAEAIAEIEVLLARGDKIPQKALDFYNNHIRR